MPADLFTSTISAEPSATSTVDDTSSSGGDKTGAIVGGQSPLLLSCVIDLTLGDLRCRRWGLPADHHPDHRVLRCSP